MSRQSNEYGNEIAIPSDSFTAFRFLYGDSVQISNSSQIVLLGSIPKIWYKEQGLFLSWLGFNSNSKEIKHNLFHVFENSHSKFGIRDIRDDPYAKKMIKSIYRHEQNDEDDDHDTDREHDHDEDDAAEFDTDDDIRLNSDEDDYDFVRQKQSRKSLRSFLSNKILQNSTHKPTAITNDTITPSFHTATVENPRILINDADDEIVPLSNDNFTVQSDDISDVGSSAVSTRTVKFQSERPRSTSQMTLLKPQPVSDELIEPIDQSRKEIRMEKVKTAALNTKLKFKKDMVKLNQKKFFNLLTKSYATGEVIKLERMLVLIKSSQSALFENYTEAEQCDTRIFERWKEYIVVARSTGDLNNPVLMQFYTKREIKEIDSRKHEAHDLDFKLNRSSFFISFYNSLDKTISIVNSNNKRIYILKCQTQNSSIRWLTFLNGSLGQNHDNTIKVEIPKLKISMTLNLSLELRHLIETFDKRSKTLTLYLKPRGYDRENLPIVTQLSDKIKTRLTEAGFHDIVKTYGGSEHLLGFCWRYFDRLEWVFGENFSNLIWQRSMSRTHQLELRQIQHYPSSVTTGEGIILSEPSPIEGFLVRLTTLEGSQKSGLLRKQVFKFCYFNTSDNLLFFTLSSKALPPLPFTDTIIDPGAYSTFDQSIKARAGIPKVYSHNAYELDGQQHIKWLSPDLQVADFEKRDKHAIYEFERRIALILRSESVLDMCDIEEVVEVSHDHIPVSVDMACALFWDDMSVENHPFMIKDRDCYFKLIMQNRTELILRAPTSDIRNEWITRLRDLVRYWKIRISEDSCRERDLKKSNINDLNMDDYTEATLNDSTTNWESLKGSADPIIHNITPASMFRPIVKKSYLYSKPKKHSKFRKLFVVLVPGFLILYQAFRRDFKGDVKATYQHSHYMTIPISKCYIYSGNLCGLDLLDTDRQNIHETAGRNDSLPRVYEDGWLSSDDESSRCFTLWFGQKRTISGKSKDSTSDTQGLSREEAPKNPGLIKTVSRLGVTGRSMVFMCRSRQEKDLWVENLYTGLERFASTDI